MKCCAELKKCLQQSAEPNGKDCCKTKITHKNLLTLGKKYASNLLDCTLLSNIAICSPSSNLSNKIKRVLLQYNMQISKQLYICNNNGIIPFHGDTVMLYIFHIKGLNHKALCNIIFAIDTKKVEGIGLINAENSNNLHKGGKMSVACYTSPYLPTIPKKPNNTA